MKLSTAYLILAGQHRGHHATRSLNNTIKRYLDLKGSFEATGKESPERSHNGGERGERDAVDLERIETHGALWRQQETCDHNR